MHFIQALVSALKGVFTISGRSERTEIWAIVMFTWLMWFALVGPFYVVFLEALRLRDPARLMSWAEKMMSDTSGQMAYFLFVSLVFAYLGLARFMVEVRRLHDLNMTGFWALVPILVPMFSLSTVVLVTGGVSFLPDLPTSLRAQIAPFVPLVMISTWFLTGTLRLFIIWKTLFFAGDEKDNAYGPPV